MTRNVALLGLVLAIIGLYVGVRGSAVAQESVDCPNPNEVTQFSGTGEQQTEFFEISTSRFRILSEYLNVEPGPDLLLVNIPENERGESIFPSAPTPEIGDEPEPPNTGEEIVNATPGRYRLNIQPQSQDREYVVTVEECEPPTSGGDDTTTPSPPPAPKTQSPPPPAPKTPAIPPKTPTPAPGPEPNSGTLMEAGGTMTGPVPLMSNGSCPREFPTMRDGTCHS